MQLGIDTTQITTNIPECMAIHKLQQTMSQDKHLQHLKDHIIQSWPESRDLTQQGMRTYWIFWDDMAVFDGIILNSRHILIPKALQKQALQQLYVNHNRIEKKLKNYCVNQFIG